MNAYFVFGLVNHSRENRNYEVLAELGFPQRFGFPVLVILDASGNRIHTQNSAYLEQEKSYDEKKMIEFLQNWSPRALDPNSYKY
jgi:hypothetical protein